MLQSTIAWACGTITSLHASGWPIFSDVFYRCYSRRHNTYLQNPFNQGFLFAELIVFSSMLACLDEKVLRTRKHVFFQFFLCPIKLLNFKESFEKAVLWPSGIVGREITFKENDPSVPIKTREEKVFRLEKKGRSPLLMSYLFQRWILILVPEQSEN